MPDRLYYPRYIPNTELHASKLRTAIRPNQRIYTPEIAISEQVDAYWAINLDPSIRQSIEVMCRNIVGRIWKIEPASSERQDRELNGILTEQIEEIEDFTQARMTMAKEASILGESYGFIRGKRKRANYEGKGYQDYWIPDRIEHIDRNRIRKITNENGVGYRYKYFDYAENDWVWMESNQYQALIYINNSSEEGRFTFGNGLLDPLFVIHTFKQNFFQELLNLAERYGQGFTELGIDGFLENNDGDTVRTLQELNDAYEGLIEDIKSRHFFIKRKEDEIKIHDPSNTGYQILMDGINYFDGLHRMLCIGSLLTVTQGNQGTGSYALGMVHQDSEFNHARYIRTIIDESLTKSLVKLVWRLNRPQYANIGLADARPGKFITPEERNNNFELNVRRLESAQRIGLSLVKSEAYSLLGITEPTEEDEIIKPPAENLPYPVDPYDPKDRVFESGEEVLQTPEEIEANRERRKVEDFEKQKEKLKLQIEADKARQNLGLDSGKKDDLVTNAQSFAQRALADFNKKPSAESKFIALQAMDFVEKIKEFQN